MREAGGELEPGNGLFGDGGPQCSGIALAELLQGLLKLGSTLRDFATDLPRGLARSDVVGPHSPQPIAHDLFLLLQDGGALLRQILLLRRVVD